MSSIGSEEAPRENLKSSDGSFAMEQHLTKEEEHETDPQVEFCNLSSSRSLQRPSDHYIPPPRRSHIASRLLRDPWTTALTQFSKVTNYVLNPYEDYEGPSLLRNTLKDPLGYARQREDAAHYGNRRDSQSEPILHPPPALPPIDCTVPQQRLPPLTLDEYNSKYINAPRRTLLERIFKGGIESHSLRRTIWPVVLGITEKVDQFDWSQLQSLYTYFANQWKAILPEQESRFMSYRERRSLIDRDVVRCDRTHFFFSDSNVVNVEKLRQLLMTYIMYDFDTGYVQGMTDLAAPLLYVWDGDIPKAFWCFVQIMNLFKRNFELTQQAITNQLKALLKLVRITDPVFAQYLCNNDSENCYFAFRWIICLFKREFMKRKTDDYDECLLVWETIWSIYSLASLDEDKQEKFLDQSLSPIFQEVESRKRLLWSNEDNENIINKSNSNNTRNSDNSSNGIIEVSDETGTPTETDYQPLLPTLECNMFPHIPSINHLRLQQAQQPKSSSNLSEDGIEENIDENDVPVRTSRSPLPIPTKKSTFKLSTPPKPRPVLSSSPISSSVYVHTLSPPVREMYVTKAMIDHNNDFILCSAGSPVLKDAKESNGDIKRPVKPSDSSDEVKSDEFEHLTGPPDLSSSKQLTKLENFELFVLCISLAIVRRERDIILSRKYEASEILKHFNTLQLNDCLNSILLHSMTIWHWLKNDGGERLLYDEEKPSNTSVDDFDLLNDCDVADCQNFAALNV